MPPRVLVLGEGRDEEGDDYYVSPDPGEEIDEELLGAAHILVRRIFQEILTVPGAHFIAPPRLRGSRRPGNGGLIADLDGLPRFPQNPRRKGWLEMCVGNNQVDLVVVLKDAAQPGNEDGIRGEIKRTVAGRQPPGGLNVIPAVATPSIEGWLMQVPEERGITEREAKELWASQNNPKDASGKAGVARDLDLQRLQICNPSGFGALVKSLREWCSLRFRGP